MAEKIVSKVGGSSQNSNMMFYHNKSIVRNTWYLIGTITTESWLVKAVLIAIHRSIKDLYLRYNDASSNWTESTVSNLAGTDSSTVGLKFNGKTVNIYVKPPWYGELMYTVLAVSGENPSKIWQIPEQTSLTDGDMDMIG